MRSLDIIARAIPLLGGLFLMAADPNECTIHIVTSVEGADGEGEGEGQGSDACIVDSDCEQGQVCHHDQVCPPCDDPNQACPDHCILNDTGTCIDAPATTGEGEGEGNVCTVFCTPDTHCVNNQCIPNDTCSSDTDCGPNRACVDGACVTQDPPPPPPPPVCNILCSPGTHCVNDQCVPNEECQTDADCGPNRVCLIDPTSTNSDTGVCVTQDPPPPPPPPVCTILCSPDTHCVNDQCIPNDACQTDADCGEYQVCLHDPSSTNGGNDGVCVTQDPAHP